jgi:hypothetical protein
MRMRSAKSSRAALFYGRPRPCFLVVFAPIIGTNSRSSGRRPDAGRPYFPRVRRGRQVGLD